MQFISFKFLQPPVITPIEYSYQAESENTIGDVVKVRCEEQPVPELITLCKKLSRPAMIKMFGQDVADAAEPFHFALFGLELREASDKKSWQEEVAFNLILGMRGREVKIKTPFFGMFDTYQGSFPGTREDLNMEVLGQDITYSVRRLIEACMAYINGERAQMTLEFDAEAEEVQTPQLPGFDEKTEG